MAQARLVIKIGGRQVDDPHFLEGLVETARDMADRRMLIVHGGGKEIAAWQGRLGLEPHFVEGLRVTDAQSLEVAEMVLSGLVNKRLVARLVADGVDAVGLSGVDGGLIRVERMSHPAGDLGFVGRVVEVAPALLEILLKQGLLPVISPISLGLDGHTYNVNADHAALAIAHAVEAEALVFVSDVPGVLVEGRTLAHLDADQIEPLIQAEVIRGGMVPKVRSAQEALNEGIPTVRITDLEGLRSGKGTAITM
ncbi:MAG: acetylglutamate kinase [Chloroflexota bacterium]|nr:acetylglutamate kinase [Chloroflexota bacterium]